MTKDNPPYLITLAVQAIAQAPAQWEQNVQSVSKNADTVLPQTSTGLIQGALRVALARNDDRLSRFSSQELSDEFNKRVNSFLNQPLLQTFDDTMKFILRVGCVLLRMGRLDKDPKLAKIVFDTGCVKNIGSGRNISQLRENDFKKLGRNLGDAARYRSMEIKNENLLIKIQKIMVKLPPSRIKLVDDLAFGLFNTIANVYDHEYTKWASPISYPLPREFLILLEGALQGSFVAFRATKFFVVTKKLLDLSNTDLKSIDVSTLPARLEEKSKQKSDLETKQLHKFYNKIIYHAQTLLTFYKRFTSAAPSQEMKSLKRTFAALKVFREKASRQNSNNLTARTFDLSASLGVNKSNSRNRYSEIFKNLYLTNKNLSKRNLTNGTRKLTNGTRKLTNTRTNRTNVRTTAYYS